MRAVTGLSGLTGLVGDGGGGAGVGSQTRSPGAAISNSLRSPAVAWTQPANVLADDGSYASVTLLPGEVSEWLDCTQFSFAIPGGAAITSVEAEVKGFSLHAADSVDDTAKLLLNASNPDGSYGPNNLATGADIGTATAVYSYGGDPPTTWGVNPDPGIIMEANFGFRFAVRNDHATESRTFQIGHIRMIVEWS
jgi:hypothetical protein